jgi:hypothetical protein
MALRPRQRASVIFRAFSHPAQESIEATLRRRISACGSGFFWRGMFCHSYNAVSSVLQAGVFRLGIGQIVCDMDLGLNRGLKVLRGIVRKGVKGDARRPWIRPL